MRGRRRVGNLVALVVQEAGAQAGEHARAAVRVGAAAHAQDHPGAAGVECGGDQFAGAATGGFARSEDRFAVRVVGQCREAGGQGHLDHGGVVEARPGRDHGFADGAGDREVVARVAGGDRGIQRALTAVGHGRIVT